MEEENITNDLTQGKNAKLAVKHARKIFFYYKWYQYRVVFRSLSDI